MSHGQKPIVWNEWQAAAHEKAMGGVHQSDFAAGCARELTPGVAENGHLTK
jgi:hypothetical protein